MILNKKIWSWALYDWANSAFSTTIVAGFFPIFFEKFWSDPDVDKSGSYKKINERAIVAHVAI